MRKYIQKIRAQKGASSIEYAILVCLIGAFCYAAWQQLGENLQAGIEAADERISNLAESANNGG